MLNNPIIPPLPADLPTDWNYGQTVAPNGADIGMAEKYGYNYLMRQVNAAQTSINLIAGAVSDLQASVMVIPTLPAQSGALVYTGSAQTPAWNGYDAEKLTISDAVPRTDAGHYNVFFTPKSGFRWWDGSTEKKSAAWSIEKAPGSLSLAPASLVLDAASSSQSVSVTRPGDGTIAAVSSDTSVATVSVTEAAGEHPVVHVSGTEDGEAIVTVYAAEGSNYTASEKRAVAVSVSLTPPVPTSQTFRMQSFFTNVPIYLFWNGEPYIDGSDVETTNSISEISIGNGGNGGIAIYVTADGTEPLDQQHCAIHVSYSSSAVPGIYAAFAYANGKKEFTGNLLEPDSSYTFKYGLTKLDFSTDELI